jgi:hypothetical protein
LVVSAEAVIMREFLTNLRAVLMCLVRAIDAGAIQAGLRRATVPP